MGELPVLAMPMGADQGEIAALCEYHTSLIRSTDRPVDDSYTIWRREKPEADVYALL